MCNIRIGHGYDVHRLVSDRPLVLGGVRVEHTLGLLGHSDADVLIHAIIDAVLGALGMGDIGKHFPDTDPQYGGISSMILLSRVAEMMHSEHARIVNLDCTIIAQKPKLSPYIDKMRENISSVFGVDISAVNIKATSEEHLGFTGREEGIAAHSVCLISLG